MSNHETIGETPKFQFFPPKITDFIRLVFRYEALARFGHWAGMMLILLILMHIMHLVLGGVS